MRFFHRYYKILSFRFCLYCPLSILPILIILQTSPAQACISGSGSFFPYGAIVSVTNASGGSDLMICSGHSWDSTDWRKVSNNSARQRATQFNTTFGLGGAGNNRPYVNVPVINSQGNVTDTIYFPAYEIPPPPPSPIIASPILKKDRAIVGWGNSQLADEKDSHLDNFSNKPLYNIQVSCDRSFQTYIKPSIPNQGSAPQSLCEQISDNDRGDIDRDPSIRRYHASQQLSLSPVRSYWRVMPLNHDYSQSSDWSNVSVTSPPLPPPSYKRPVTLTFPHISGAIKYNVLIAKNKENLTSASAIYIAKDIDTTSVTRNFPPGMKFYWAVEGINSSGKVIPKNSNNSSAAKYVYDIASQQLPQRSWFYNSANPIGLNAGEVRYRRNLSGSAQKYKYLTWPKIPGATRYEVQVSKHFEIPTGLAFEQGAVTNGTIATGGHANPNVSLPTLIFDNNMANAWLNSSDDRLATNPGFQFSFPFLLPGDQYNFSPRFYYRVRGFDKNNKLVTLPTYVHDKRVDIKPIPYDYPSAVLDWPQDSSAIAHIIDLVKGSPDFSLFPPITVEDSPVSTDRIISRSQSETGQDQGNILSAKKIDKKPKLQKRLNRQNVSEMHKANIGTPISVSSSNLLASLNDDQWIMRHANVVATIDPLQVAAIRLKDKITRERIGVDQIYKSAGFTQNDAEHYGFVDLIDLSLAWLDPSAGIDDLAPKLIDTLGISVSVSSANRKTLEISPPVTILDKSTGGASISVQQTQNKTLLTLGGSGGKYIAEFQLGNGAVSQSSVLGINSDNNKHYFLAKRLVPGDYYWRVRAIYQNGYGNWSNTRKLVVRRVPFPWELNGPIINTLAQPTHILRTSTLNNLTDTLRKRVKSQQRINYRKLKRSN